MLVKQIMSQPVVACRVDDSLQKAAQLMWEHDFGVVPITDADGRAVAMLTDRDICMAALTQGKPLAQLSVRTAMSHDFYACTPEDTLEQAAQLMREHQVRRIPVLRKDGHPVGVLSLNDISLAATRQHPAAPKSSDSISVNKAAQTFAAVCVHRFELARPQLS